MRDHVLITGAAGLVGQNLVQRLTKANYDVLAMDKNDHNLRILKRLNLSAQTYLADLSRPGSWQDEFGRVDIVVQLQAKIVSKSESDLFRNNIESVRNVVAASLTHRVRHLIHVSSSVIFSPINDVYTRSKREAEKLVESSGIPYTILRAPLMYGCFDVKHIGWITRFLEKSPIFPVIGTGRFPRQTLCVGDLYEVILASIMKGPSDTIYNIIGLERIDYIDLMKTISKERRLKRLFVNLPIPLFRFCINLYDLLARKPNFTTAQIDSLTTGDAFPVESWTDTFNVEYTPYLKGIRETLNSPYYKYRDMMISTY